MNSKNPPNEEDSNTNKVVDPLIFLIWGILLSIYGLYMVYSSFINPLETQKLFAIGPNLIILVFGVIMTARGYRDYKLEKKED